MSYDEYDEAWDDAYERMAQELYPDHKEQAIAEFTRERLRSYYAANPNVHFTSKRVFDEAKVLAGTGHHGAALVFAATATELLLKAVLLRPLLGGLIHNEAFVELVVSATLSQTGFARYEQLLSKIFLDITGVELRGITRKPSVKPLLEEVSDIQKLRNKVVHQGREITADEAQLSIEVAKAVANQVLAKVLASLGFSAQKGGLLVDDEA